MVDERNGTLLAIDPGNEKSAWLVWDLANYAPRERGIDPNNRVREVIGDLRLPLAIEGLESYGMPVGRHVMDTAIWIGRFIELTEPRPHRILYRSKIKLHLCNARSAKDGNIRRALMDRFARSGGGKTPEIGTKSEPGPLYGFSTHLWSALAVAVTYHEVLHETPDALPGAVVV